MEAKGLSKAFSKVAALDGLTFDVENGSITGLMGTNGTGKTTEFRAALGLLRPRHGYGEGPDTRVGA